MIHDKPSASGTKEMARQGLRVPPHLNILLSELRALTLQVVCELVTLHSSQQLLPRPLPAVEYIPRLRQGPYVTFLSSVHGND